MADQQEGSGTSGRPAAGGGGGGAGGSGGANRNRNRNRGGQTSGPGGGNAVGGGSRGAGSGGASGSASGRNSNNGNNPSTKKGNDRNNSRWRNLLFIVQNSFPSHHKPEPVPSLCRSCPILLTGCRLPAGWNPRSSVILSAQPRCWRVNRSEATPGLTSSGRNSFGESASLSDRRPCSGRMC